MRILFVTNMFPPYGRGGYEQWCEEVAYELVARGHTLAILTSRAPTVNGAAALDAQKPFAVFRLLYTQVEGNLAHTIVRLLREPKRFEAQNLEAVRNVLDEYAPTVVLVWGMWNIDRSVSQLLEALMGSRIAYYLCDYWPSLPDAYTQRLQEPALRAQMQQVKDIVSRYFLPRLLTAGDPSLRLENPICVSRAVRDLLVSRGVNVAHAQIIYGGTSIDESVLRNDPMVAGLRLLYIGRVERIKGVHTVVRAMLDTPDDVTLDVVGSGPPEYVAEINAIIDDGGLRGRIRLAGAVPRAEIPRVLAQHDALIFSSEWEEPFARTVLEAMAASLPVIGTTTGGTGELLVDGETGLTYAAGDSAQLAAQIRRLQQHPELRRQLADTARRIIEQHYTIGRMVDELEAALTALAHEPIFTSHKEDVL